MTGAYYRLKYYPPFFLLSIVFLSSCGSYKKNTLFNSKYDVLADTAKTIYVANAQDTYSKEYIIRVGDRLQIRNLQDPELPASTTVTSSTITTLNGFLVEPDSTFLLPAIGKIKIAGFTKENARKLIENLYKEKLLKNPIIELNIANFYVNVLGEFTRVGKISFEQVNPSLIEILALSGGITEFAEPRKLKIIRGKLDNPEIIYINLTDINSLSSKKVVIQNGDLLYIPKKKIEYLNSNIRSFGNLIQPLLILVNTALLVYNFTRQ